MSLAFQWLQEIKEKKRVQAKAALGVRKSPRSHPVKVFYGESLEEEKKKGASRPKLRSPPKKPKMKSPKKKEKVLCRLILYWDSSHTPWQSGCGISWVFRC